jgi:hypothetical protein
MAIARPSEIHLHENAERLRLLSETDANIYNTHFSNASFLFQTLDLLDDVLFFLNLKELRKLCMVSRGFSDFITSNGNKAKKGEFQILFKNLDGTLTTMMVGKDDSIKNLRCTYAKKKEITELFPGWLRFTFAGRPLGRMPREENKTIGDYNIGRNSTIQVMGAFRGD